MNRGEEKSEETLGLSRLVEDEEDEEEDEEEDKDKDAEEDL